MCFEYVLRFLKENQSLTFKIIFLNKLTLYTLLIYSIANIAFNWRISFVVFCKHVRHNILLAYQSFIAQTTGIPKSVRIQMIAIVPPSIEALST